jgi:hypothetical protein
MNPDEVDDRIVRREVEVAAYIRQLMRATEARDQAAAQLETRAVCWYLNHLLAAHLRHAPGWDSEGRWLDGLIPDQLEVEPPDHFAVRGRILWALLDHPEGPFWGEPFEADVRIDWKTQGMSYVMRFSDDRGPDQKRFRRAAEPENLASVRWAFQFRKD